jgi:hypothetical protein
LLVADDVFEGVNESDEDDEPEAETLGNEKKKVPKDYLLLIDTVITLFYNGNREISEVWSPGSTAVGGAPRVAKGKAVAAPLQSLKDQLLGLLECEEKELAAVVPARTALPAQAAVPAQPAVPAQRVATEKRLAKEDGKRRKKAVQQEEREAKKKRKMEAAVKVVKAKYRPLC